ncbi:hypothetical protein KY289_007578 [Solanum tuberosum]|nr:hypothetical protein KY289_007578 [Solanum tuberosum]KAH0716149.1 hypothetical protein KY284_009054 [Solanum tuberosum]
MAFCHRLFLLGLDKYGKGDWRSISRNVVVTRTPTQQSMKKERKRSSIHDISTAVDTKMVPPQNSLQNQGGTSGLFHEATSQALDRMIKRLLSSLPDRRAAEKNY